MNPYPERIRELHEFLADRYAQHDTQATEILLASMLPSALLRVRRPWIVIETDYPSRETSDAWFAFGGEMVPQPHSLAQVRVIHQRAGAELILRWDAERMSTDAMGLFVESEWRCLPRSWRGPPAKRKFAYDQLMGQTLRLRVNHPRGAYALRLDRDKDKLELARLTRRVLDCSQRTLSGTLLTFDMSALPGQVHPSLLYWCELLQVVSPRHNDWECLIASLAACARGIAVLYNDGRAPDWRAADRLIRDCINNTTLWIMQMAACKSGISMRYFTTRRDSPDTKMTAAPELKRLFYAGVLRAIGPHKRPWRYVIAGERDGKGVSPWRELIDRSKLILP